MLQKPLICQQRSRQFIRLRKVLLENLGLTPVRIVRLPIVAIGHAIAIAIPAVAFMLPSVIVRNVAMRLIVIAVMRLHPGTGNPDLAMTAPIPVSRHPVVTVARLRMPLKTRSQRRKLHVNARGRGANLWNCQRTQCAGSNQQCRHYFPRELECKHRRNLQ